jgi:lipopolysaccharide transport system ATP-binding protein
MYVRLAFALAASVSPDILIIDEALSVGDAYFQQKCLQRIHRFRDDGVTILFVSHDPGVVKMLCNRATLLDQGRMLGIGEPIDMLETYNALLAKREGVGKEYVRASTDEDIFGRKQLRSGNRRATIERVQLVDRTGARLEAIVAGCEAAIAVDVAFHDDISNPTVGILIRDRLGYDIFGTNSFEMAIDSGEFASGSKARFLFGLKMNLGPGDYTVTSAVHSSNTHIEDCFEWVDRILSFKVLPRSDFRFLGVSCLEPQISIQH